MMSLCITWWLQFPSHKFFAHAIVVAGKLEIGYQNAGEETVKTFCFGMVEILSITKVGEKSEHYDLELNDFEF